MRGPVNTKIKLRVMRKGQDKPVDISITRDIIRVRAVRSNMNGDDVAYIKLTQFNEQTTDGLKKAIADLTAQIPAEKLKGFIIDLRNNPGGLLDQAVAVADAFIDKGEIVSTRGRRPDSVQRFNARPGDIAEGIPMVVLINGGSASASEIVAGALQDQRRAIVMGTQSFGKGSVQTIMPLSGEGAIRLTTARYYTPAGTSIQAKGITPDIEVHQANVEQLDDEPGRREADLRGRLQNEQAPQGEASTAQPPEMGEPVDGKDYQLARALDLLRGISLYEGRAPVANSKG